MNASEYLFIYLCLLCANIDRASLTKNRSIKNIVFNPNSLLTQYNLTHKSIKSIDEMESKDRGILRDILRNHVLLPISTDLRFINLIKQTGEDKYLEICNNTELQLDTANGKCIRPYIKIYKKLLVKENHNVILDCLCKIFGFEYTSIDDFFTKYNNESALYRSLDDIHKDTTYLKGRQSLYITAEYIILFATTGIDDPNCRINSQIKDDMYLSKNYNSAMRAKYQDFPECINRSKITYNLWVINPVNTGAFYSINSKIHQFNEINQLYDCYHLSNVYTIEKLGDLDIIFRPPMVIVIKKTITDIKEIIKICNYVGKSKPDNKYLYKVLYNNIVNEKTKIELVSIFKKEKRTKHYPAEDIFIGTFFEPVAVELIHTVA